ncbi:MAG: helix-turn-helix domain-containing protein, partial [Haloechinothrix sp.]
MGAELRELRKPSGLTIIDLGRQVGLSKSTIARIETGERLPDDTEIALILGALGVTGSRRDTLITMAHEAQKPNWLATGVAGLPEQLTTLVDYELTAIAITEVSLTVIPGLLQSRDYSRVIYDAAGVPLGEIETRAAIRIGRQEILTRDNPAQFCAVVDEAALRRPIGGPQVAAAQLRHLLRMGERPNITVQVLPNGLGAHPAIN